jgi:ParB-like chromosome segregation protein Spo0J
MKLFTEEISQISVGEIIPNKINPNKMPPPTFEKLKLSLTKFGQLNPIIVRRVSPKTYKTGCKTPDGLDIITSDSVIKYQIIDGEWRWKACLALGWSEIQAKVIDATEEEVAGLIFASTIKGKHDVYDATDLIEELMKTETESDLKAMNLDKSKIQRKTKYHGSDKIQVVQRQEKGQRNEKDSGNVKPIDKFKQLIFLVDAPKYCKIEDGKVVLK